MKLTFEQMRIHERAVDLAKNYRIAETSLIGILQEVERLKIYRSLEKSSLFVYAVEVLELEKGVAYPMITIARKSVMIPELKKAIESKLLPFSKASRIVSILTPENANDLIRFAETHSREEIDLEVARRNPRAGSRDKMKVLSEDCVELRLSMSLGTFEKLKRAEALEAQKGNPAKWGDVLDRSLEAYLDKNDPVRKAERAQKRNIGLLRARVPSGEKRLYEFPKKRWPLTAEQKHAVHLRDLGKCTHVDQRGKRCISDKWVEIHHIVPVSKGGTNDPSNLTTLCSFHHDLAHQLSLPLDDQVTWLRSPRATYSAREIGVLVYPPGAVRAPSENLGWKFSWRS